MSSNKSYIARVFYIGLLPFCIFRILSSIGYCRHCVISYHAAFYAELIYFNHHFWEWISSPLSTEVTFLCFRSRWPIASMVVVNTLASLVTHPVSSRCLRPRIHRTGCPLKHLRTAPPRTPTWATWPLVVATSGHQDQPTTSHLLYSTLSTHNTHNTHRDTHRDTHRTKATR